MTQHEYNVERDAEEWAAHMIKRVQELKQQNAELLAAMIRTERKLSAYVGVCTGDKELLLTVLPMAREAIAKAGK